MSGLFSKPELPATGPVSYNQMSQIPAPPKIIPAAVQPKVTDSGENAAQAERLRRLYARGKSSTILTSALGSPTGGTSATGSKNLGGT